MKIARKIRKLIFGVDFEELFERYSWRTQYLVSQEVFHKFFAEIGRQDLEILLECKDYQTMAETWNRIMEHRKSTPIVNGYADVRLKTFLEKNYPQASVKLKNSSCQNSQNMIV